MNFDTKLSGVTFNDCQQLIAALAADTNLVIIPDPDNEHDPNALGVHESDINGARIGWVPRALAARLAPRLKGRSVPVTHWIRTGGGEGFAWGLVIFFDLEG